MPSQQALQRLLLDMQGQAQANLPVIPNNGNPQGANNMPATDVVAQPQPALPVEHYPWMRASPSMDLIQRLLNRRSAGVAPPTSTLPATPVATGPVLPTMSSPLPSDMIRNQTVVLPNPRPSALERKYSDLSQWTGM